MEEPNSKNSSNESPAGNHAGRRRRLQQDCTVKLFPPISPSTESPSNHENPAKIAATTTAAGRKSHGDCEGGCHTCCCCCRYKKKHQRSRCNSRMIDSALSSCSSSSSCSSRSTASSWSSCSSRSSAASSVSDCSSLLERESSTLRTLSRSREVKDVLKRIAEELASNDDIGGIGLNKAKGVLGDSRGDPRAPPPSRVLTGVCMPTCIKVFPFCAMCVVSLFCPYLEGKLNEHFMAFCQKEQLLFLATCKLYRNAMHCFDGNGYCHACFNFLHLTKNLQHPLSH